MKDRFLHILFWSVLSAAFIGPGTVTTAASAGTEFGYALIWALLFSTAACFILQEASARVYTVSGLNLGEAIQKEYSEQRWGQWGIGLVLLSIITGCAAFEAGNIVGASAGVSLLSDSIPEWLIVSAIGITAGTLLWKGTTRQIATLLGVIVSIMGFCFLITAFLLPHDFVQLFQGSITPSIPGGSEILVLGLIGTTVVPYNIFLGSGLKHTQSRREMRVSLFIAISLGGFISVTILLTGTAISGSFTFEALAEALSERLGTWAYALLGIGLFGAGISSALTAALAASITAKSLLADSDRDLKWREDSLRFRSVWLFVLATGLIFGLLGLQPVPVIILAQALNGMILPLIAVVLFLLINNRRIISPAHQNGSLYNTITAIVVFLCVLIGLTNVFRAITRATGFEVMQQSTILILSFCIFALLLIPIVRNLSGNHT